MGPIRAGELRDDFLWVTDLETNRQWRTTPDNAGHSRDFNRVEWKGLPPDVVEQQVLSVIEGKAATAIRHVKEKQSLPADEELRLQLMRFIALLATRVPQMRSFVDRCVDEVNQKVLQMSLAHREQWEATQREMRDKGLLPEYLDASYEEQKEFADSGKLRFKATQNWQIRLMFECANMIVPQLMGRRWSLLLSSAGRFICTDNPVVLYFNRPKPPHMFPGFALPDTTVVVPLSRHIVLQGTWAGNAQVQSLNFRGVAFLNGLLLAHAERFIYSSTKDFPWQGDHHSLNYGPPPN